MFFCMIITYKLELLKTVPKFSFQNGVWVTSSEYMNAVPDPLRNFAENIVEEMNFRHAEDVLRLCNVYVELGFQV